MQDKYILSRFTEISESIEKAKTSSKSNTELASMLSSYLVVFISGIYEDCIEYMFSQRAGKNQDKEIQSLVTALIDQTFRNPDYGKICGLLKCYNNSVLLKLKTKLDSKVETSINSIVENKNYVAHGKKSNATLKDIEIYHSASIILFNELEKILL